MVQTVTAVPTITQQMTALQGKHTGVLIKTTTLPTAHTPAGITGWDLAGEMTLSVLLEIA